MVWIYPKCINFFFLCWLLLYSPMGPMLRCCIGFSHSLSALARSLLRFGIIFTLSFLHMKWVSVSAKILYVSHHDYLNAFSLKVDLSLLLSAQTWKFSSEEEFSICSSWASVVSALNILSVRWCDAKSRVHRCGVDLSQREMLCCGMSNVSIVRLWILFRCWWWWPQLLTLSSAWMLFG